MNLVKWDPFPELRAFRSEIDKMFAPRANGGRPAVSEIWAPAVDILEDEHAITIKTELPEMEKKDINVDVHDGVLTISGERKLEKEEKKENYTRIERSYGSFSRSFTLPESVDEKKIAAEYANGVLRLTLPKSKPVKAEATKISVN